MTLDDDGPDILRVENCSEVDVAGDSYIQDGKCYDDCCDFENEDAPECVEDPIWSWWEILIVVLFFILWSSFIWLPIFRCCVKICSNKCYDACCEPQPIARNDNNVLISRPAGP